MSVPFDYDSRPGNTFGWVRSQDVYVFTSQPHPMYSGGGSDVNAPTASLEYVGWASFEVVPEPSTLFLAMFGLVALLATWNWRVIPE